MATEHWLRLARHFEECFYWEGLGAVEEQNLNEYFSSPRPGNPKLLRYACWLLYRDIKARDTLRLLQVAPATVRPGSPLAFQFHGDAVSWDQLISIDAFYAILEADPGFLASRRVVLDLGAGWGRLGYLLRRANPESAYIIADLPEALIVAHEYLPQLLPGHPIRSYDENRSILRFSREVLREPGVRFCGAHDLERFEDKSIDVFINIASFQEMTRQQVAAYVQLIDRKVRGIFYTQQLWTSRTHSLSLGEIAGWEEYPFPPHWKLAFVRDLRWSDLYFEAAFEIT